MSAVNRATFQQAFGRGGLATVERICPSSQFVKTFLDGFGQIARCRAYHERECGYASGKNPRVWRVVGEVARRAVARTDRAESAPARQRGRPQSRPVPDLQNRKRPDAELADARGAQSCVCRPDKRDHRASTSVYSISGI